MTTKTKQVTLPITVVVTLIIAIAGAAGNFSHTSTKLDSLEKQQDREHLEFEGEITQLHSNDSTILVEIQEIKTDMKIQRINDSIQTEMMKEILDEVKK